VKLGPKRKKLGPKRKLSPAEEQVARDLRLADRGVDQFAHRRAQWQMAGTEYLYASFHVRHNRPFGARASGRSGARRSASPGFYLTMHKRGLPSCRDRGPTTFAGSTSVRPAGYH
jgi:hypothetical protein